MPSRNAALKVDGLTALLRDLNKLPKETQKEIRKGSLAIARDIANDLHGWGGTRQAAPLLDRVKARNDRIPNIKLGGDSPARVSGGATLNELLGANFGSNGGHPQFPPTVRPDYYVYALIRHRGEWITRTWVDNVARALATVDPANKGV